MVLCFGRTASSHAAKQKARKSSRPTIPGGGHVRWLSICQNLACSTAFSRMLEIDVLPAEPFCLPWSSGLGKSSSSESSTIPYMCDRRRRTLDDTENKVNSATSFEKRKARGLLHYSGDFHRCGVLPIKLPCGGELIYHISCKRLPTASLPDRRHFAAPQDD